MVIRAPGRVNLIGEHTDYNDGFVLPMAINRAVWIALSHRPGCEVSLHSLDFDETKTFDAAHPEKGEHSWIEYAKGVAWALNDAEYRLGGWYGVMKGDVPLGSGLSSSAALELAVARAFEESNGLDVSEADLALLSQKAENKWVGVNCGIMDQLVSSAGREGAAILIDCRSLEITPVPLPSETSVVIMDTGTRRKLQASAYNERRSQCEAGAALFGAEKLRDVTIAELEEKRTEMDDLTFRRCRHVITENARTIEAAEVLERGDAVRFGVLMNESHMSLRDDFEVSSPALDAISEAARRAPGCLGARMTGAGFGGCGVALVYTKDVDGFIAQVEEEYRAATGNEPAFYATEATAGARCVYRTEATTNCLTLRMW